MTRVAVALALTVATGVFIAAGIAGVAIGEGVTPFAHLFTP